MAAQEAHAWLGNSPTGGRLVLAADDMKGGVCVMGRDSSELAVLVAYAADEAGLRTLVLDPQGFASGRISGRVPAYRPSYFLYDAVKMSGENPSFHAQLIASAYSTALDLSFEQEAALGAVCQELALEEGVASPLALAERMDSEDSGGASKRLRGRLNALSFLNVVGEEGALSRLLADRAVLDFEDSLTAEAAELCAALVIAKLCSAAGAGGQGLPDVVVFLQANRLFRSRPIFRQNQRLLTTFVSEPIGRVLASDVRYGLDDRFLDTAAVRILSSELWNDRRNSRVLAPGMFALRNDARGSEETFVPRSIAYSKGVVLAGTQPEGGGPSLTREILDTISSFGNSTRRSLVSYLAPERGREQVETEIDRLLREGYVETVSRKARKDSPQAALRLTAKGEDALRGRP